MQSICCFWWTKTTEELLPGEEKKKTQSKTEHIGGEKRVGLEVQSPPQTQLFFQIYWAQPGHWVWPSLLAICIYLFEASQSCSKNRALTLFPGNLLPDSVSAEGTQSCLLLRNLFACATSSRRHLHCCGEEGERGKGVPLLHNLETRWNVFSPTLICWSPLRVQEIGLQTRRQQR